MDWHGFKLDFTRKTEVPRLSLVLRKTIDSFRMTSLYSFVSEHEPGGRELNKSLRSRNRVDDAQVRHGPGAGASAFETRFPFKFPISEGLRFTIFVFNPP